MQSVTIIVLVLAVAFGAYVADRQHRLEVAESATKNRAALANIERDAREKIDKLRTEEPMALDTAEDDPCDCVVHF